MDALVVIRVGKPACRKLRDLRAGDEVVVGMRGIRVIPESKERDRLAFAFMSNGISSERQVETSVRQTIALMRHARDAGHVGQTELFMLSTTVTDAVHFNGDGWWIARN